MLLSPLSPVCLPNSSRSWQNTPIRIPGRSGQSGQEYFWLDRIKKQVPVQGDMSTGPLLNTVTRIISHWSLLDCPCYTNESGPHPCWWKVCYQRGLPRLVLILGRDGVTVRFFASIHVVRTRPAPFEKKFFLFRPNLDTFRGIFGLPGKNKN